MNKIRNNVIVPLKSRIFVHNPIRDVCQFFADSSLVLLPNNFQMTVTGNDGNVTLARRLGYYATFAIHLLMMVKFAILTKYDDQKTIVMFGESLHIMNNMYYNSRVRLCIQMGIVPIKLIFLHYGKQFVVNTLLTISRLDTSLIFNRINYRKLTKKMWLMSKLLTKTKRVFQWIIIPSIIIYCSTLVYFNSPVPYNLVTMTVNNLAHYVLSVNLVEICFFCALYFFYAMNMAQLRFKELIHLVKQYKLANLSKVNHSYNQLVIDIKLCRPLFDKLIGIIKVSKWHCFS